MKNTTTATKTTTPLEIVLGYASFTFILLVMHVVTYDSYGYLLMLATAISLLNIGGLSSWFRSRYPKQGYYQRD